MALINASDIDTLESNLSAAPPSALEVLCVGHDVSDKRRETLARAIEIGADSATLTALRDALRVNRFPYMLLPEHRFATKSRGKGWCRKGRGNNAEWAELEDNGYRVEPGKWTVGASDGFSRKGSDDWTVKHIQVGNETWTIAN
jgi:hypothetical protein